MINASKGVKVVSKKVVEYAATGRRKTSVARVKLALGVGKLTVNGEDFKAYFPGEAVHAYVLEPFVVVEAEKQYDLNAKVEGGGKAGQAGAVRHGIARALLLVNPELKPALKKNGMLTRDPRMKERKKTGQPGARRRFQFSKR